MQKKIHRPIRYQTIKKIKETIKFLLKTIKITFKVNFKSKLSVLKLSVLTDFEITELNIPKKIKNFNFFNVFGKNEEKSIYLYFYLN